jgi:hypothetical protein
MPPLARLSGSLRLFLLDAEFALSPGGQLRGLAQLACRVAVAIGMILLTVSLLLMLLSLALSVAIFAAGQLVTLMWLLIQAVLLVGLLLAVALGLLVAVRLATRSR